MEAIQAELISLLVVVISTCIGIITKSIVGYLNKEGLLKDLENNKEATRIVVNAVEQLYIKLDGKEKLDVAKSELVKVLNTKKIKVSEKEVDLLIESVVKEMNDNIKKSKQSK